MVRFFQVWLRLKIEKTGKASTALRGRRGSVGSFLGRCHTEENRLRRAGWIVSNYDPVAGGKFGLTLVPIPSRGGAVDGHERSEAQSIRSEEPLARDPVLVGHFHIGPDQVGGKNRALYLRPGKTLYHELLIAVVAHGLPEHCQSKYQGWYPEG